MSKKVNYNKLAKSGSKKKSKNERIVKFVAISMVIVMLASVVISLVVSLSVMN